MRRIFGILALCVLSVALMGASCNNPPPGGQPVDPVQKCAVIKITTDLACQSPASQSCTAAKLAFSASGCGVYVPPDLCAGKTPICTSSSASVSGPAGSVDIVKLSDGCWTSNNGQCVWIPKKENPVCPTCPVGYSCNDPQYGCIKDPEVPPAICPTCPEGYSCTDPAKGCIKDPVTPVYLDDEKLTTKPGDYDKKTWSVSEDALNSVKAKHPELFNADQTGVVDRGSTGYGDDIDNVYQLMAIELKAKGINGGSSKDDSGVISDCIFVQRKGTNEYEEVHLFEYGGGKHSTSSNCILGVYIYSGTPPVSTSCPFEPCPARVWTSETLPPGWGGDQLGKPAYVFGSKLHTMGNCDSTPVVQSQCKFCASIGLGEINGKPRCTCPVRPDGHSERETVESWLLFGGAHREGRNGKNCTPNNTDNPFAYLNDPDCRMCNSATGALQVCTTSCGGNW